MSNKLPKLEYEILRIADHYDCGEEIFWKAGEEEDGHVEFFVKCNDLFHWACGDAEALKTESDVEMWEKALLDVGQAIFEDEGDVYKDAEQAAWCNAEDGCLLYCARKRESRPQGAYYKHFEKSTWELFDACGPERDPNRLNPQARPKD